MSCGHVGDWTLESYNSTTLYSVDKDIHLEFEALLSRTVCIVVHVAITTSRICAANNRLLPVDWKSSISCTPKGRVQDTKS